MEDTSVRKQAEDLFALVKDDCASEEITHWLQEVAKSSLAHMRELADTPEDDDIPFN